MLWPFVLYNLMLLPVDLATLYYIRQVRKFRATGAGLAVLLVASVVVAMLMSTSYLMLRLTCIGWFAHMPIVLLIGAWLNRKRSKLLSISSAIIGLFVLAVAVDAFWIEPTWLQENRYVIHSDKINRPLRIVVLADIQTDHLGEYEKRVLRRTLEIKPDMILLAGDYLQVIDQERLLRLRQEMNAFLREINFSAPLGVFAVEGNNDRDEWEEMFRGLPVHACIDTQPHQVGDVRVTCLSMRDSFWTNARVASVDPFHIALGHSPNFALGDVEADLLVAGHTHGGQVRIPGLGPIITLSAIPRKWATGLTQIDEARQLIVSRGIGMERADAPRLRFLCRPELVILELKPTQKVMACPPSDQTQR